MHILMTLAMAGGNGKGGDMGGFLIFFAAIFAIMYFLIFRPQAKRQKEQRQLLDTLAKGERIITIGGIVGTIVGLKEKENTVVIEVDKNVKIEILRSAVAKKLES